MVQRKLVSVSGFSTHPALSVRKLTQLSLSENDQSHGTHNLIIIIIDYLWRPISKEPGALTDTLILSHTHTHTHTHTRMHDRTHALTHIHTHTRTHARTRALLLTGR